MFSGCQVQKKQTSGQKRFRRCPVGKVQSQLRQWPVQLHLVSPVAPYYQGADVLLTADCVATRSGVSHTDYLKGKSLAIACPKLDSGQEVLLREDQELDRGREDQYPHDPDHAVPCCSGC